MKTFKIIGIVSALVVFLPVSAFALLDKNLKFGQRDSEVTELQEFLINKGFLMSSPSTFFGLLTLKAVKEYQKSIGVSPTGFVGALTRERINSDLAVNSLGTSAIQKSTTTTQITTTTTQSDNSIYDSNTKIDKEGRTIIITQSPNYKFVNVVKASLGGVDGLYYKDTKIFLSDADIRAKELETEKNIRKIEATPSVNQTSSQGSVVNPSIPSSTYEISVGYGQPPVNVSSSDNKKFFQLTIGLKLKQGNNTPIPVGCDYSLVVINKNNPNTDGLGKCETASSGYSVYVYNGTLVPGVYLFSITSPQYNVSKTVEITVSN